jgi:hypothetical protein
LARSRNIKPSLFTNEYLSELNPLARLLFIGLWCHADREGRLEDRPKRLKVDILPYDNCDVDKLLNLLANSPERFIIRYNVDGCKYIQVTNFNKHQNPHMKEPPSIIPAPCEYSASTIQEPDKNSSSPADSLNPITLTLNPISSITMDEFFSNIWSMYPRKEGKGQVSKTQKEKLHKIGTDEITRCIERYKKATQAIEWQLHSSRVQGVVSMFNNLTESEKVECLRIINHS